ncbi:MAG: hypothetical protein JNL71_10900 [Rhodospirillales bacterium]|nr:hypothetical protein [Rhodospirillales bacterium]
MTAPTRLSLAALVLALAGCATDGARLYGSSYPSYAPSVAQTAAGDGPLPVSMTGAPFAPSEVVAAMNALPNVHRLVFAADARPGPNGYRIALSFDANTPSPCGPGQAVGYPWPKHAGSGQVVAALCRHGGTISRTAGLFPETASASDPKFRRFMSAVVEQLMPPFETDRIGGDGCARPRPEC